MLSLFNLLLGFLSIMWQYLRRIGYSQVFKWIEANPKKSTFTGIVLGSPLIDYYLKSRADKELRSPIYARLVEGSKPQMPPYPMQSQVIPRPEVSNDIIKRYFPTSAKDTVTLFGVIIGPSGNGKTFTMRELCNRFPEGVLYYHITSPESFVSGLSKEIRMKSMPTTILDLILGFVSVRYANYHELPIFPSSSGLHKVLNVLGDVSMQYIRERKKVPVLVIDGVEMLAKYKKELFETLITQAKLLAKENQLRILLVINDDDNDGIPLLSKFSATNYAWFYEMGDIPNEEALHYLMNNGIDESLAKMLVNCIGGRIVDLDNSVFLAKQNKEKYKFEEFEDIYNNIKNELFTRTLNTQRVVVTMTKPESDAILSSVSKEGHVSLSDLISKGKDTGKMMKALSQMIKANILRYDVHGQVTWYGRIQMTEFWQEVSDHEFGKTGHE